MDTTRMRMDYAARGRAAVLAAAASAADAWKLRAPAHTQLARMRGTAYAWIDQRALVVITQLLLVVCSNYAAFWLRFERAIPADEFAHFVGALPWLLAIRGVAFIPFRLYRGLWKYTSIPEAVDIVMAVASSSVGFWVVTQWQPALAGYSRSVVIVDSVVLVLLLSGVRLQKRILMRLGRGEDNKRVLVFGAGDAGEMIVRDMQNRPCGYEPVGFVDDSPAKKGQWIHGVRVFGGRHDLADIIARTKPHEVLVAMPSADASTIRRVFELLQPFKVPITTLPGVRDILDGRVAVHQIRDLTIEDLLPRAPVDLSIEPVRQLIAGSRVLVTGAGGSIGSELCRQIAALSPASLVLYERYENTLHDVTNHLVDRFGSSGIVPLVGDITDAAHVQRVFAQYRPQIVFHAAAHKHVPLMEHNPCEAVKNNVVGTATVANAATQSGVERFIMISTDKAVNPSSVMGATKRIGELMLQVISKRSATRFATVRFGNVLGSNGSVVPRLVEQIKAGGPVTVTHPDIRRFFMLIPEAVQLVLHAAALAEPGAVYVLEMGEQIRLLDLARNLIHLAGFVPDEDIPITFTGLRPGEKLFEELIADDETAQPSTVPKIVCVRGARAEDPEVLQSKIAVLVQLAVDGDPNGVTRQLRSIVPSFKPANKTPRSNFAVVAFPQRPRSLPRPAAERNPPITGSSEGPNVVSATPTGTV